MIFFRTLFGLMLMALAFPAHALESDWDAQDYVQARLISAVGTLGNANKFEGGLELRLAEGWHAYWRMPGDSGLPPRLNWDESENVEHVDLHWPAPKRFQMLDLYGFGYENQVMWPLSVEAKDPDKDVVLKLDADIMVCEEICVPQSVSLSLTVPAGQAVGSPHSARIKEAVSRLPVAEGNQRLRIENIVIGPQAVVLNIFSQRGFGNLDVFVESGDYLYITAMPEITVNKDDDRRALVRIAAPETVDNLTEELNDVEVRVTVVTGRDAVEQTVSY